MNTKKNHSWTPVVSTSVSAYAYDPETKELRVRFNTSHTAYVYEGVSRDMFQGLTTAGSVGGYVNQVIKPQHTVRKEESGG